MPEQSMPAWCEGLDTKLLEGWSASTDLVGDICRELGEFCDMRVAVRLGHFRVEVKEGEEWSCLAHLGPDCAAESVGLANAMADLIKGGQPQPDDKYSVHLRKIGSTEFTSFTKFETVGKLCEVDRLYMGDIVVSLDRAAFLYLTVLDGWWLMGNGHKPGEDYRAPTSEEQAHFREHGMLMRRSTVIHFEGVAKSL